MKLPIGELNTNPLNPEIFDECDNTKLVESFKRNGWLKMKPAVIRVPQSYDPTPNVLLDGHRRLPAAKEAGVREVPVMIDDTQFEGKKTEKLRIVELNLYRELTFSDKMRMGEILEPKELEVTKDHESKGGKGETITKHLEPLPDRVASKLGIGSGETYRKAKKVWEKAKEGSETAKRAVAKIDAGEWSISKAANVVSPPKPKSTTRKKSNISRRTSPFSVFFSKYKEGKEYFSGFGDIALFDKTDPEGDVWCPHFIKYPWAWGCPFHCAWCYLQGTFRFRPEKTTPRYANREVLVDNTKDFVAFINGVNGSSIVNSGELADSLMAEGSENALSNLVPLFKGGVKLLILTKSDNVKYLLRQPTSNTIVSFSMNAKTAADRWEKGAPSVERRLEAARKVKDAGFELRIRIDPMVPIDGWREEYSWLIDKVNELQPSVVTLGSLRGLQSTINNARDTSWVQYLSENSSWGKKIAEDVRYEMYEFAKGRLRVPFGLCKETKQMWKRLEMDYMQGKCNCID